MEEFNKKKAARLVRSYFLIHTFGTVAEITKFGQRENFIKGQKINPIVMGLLLGEVRELSKMNVLSEDKITYNNYTLLSDVKDKHSHEN